MSLRQDLALLLSPDLRDIVRRVEEVDRALEVSIRNLAEVEGMETVVVTPSPASRRRFMLDEVKADLIVSRGRLGEVVGLLTGRDPNRG